MTEGNIIAFPEKAPAEPDCASQARYCDVDPVFAVARQAYIDVVDMVQQCAAMNRLAPGLAPAMPAMSGLALAMSSRLRQIECNLLYIGITRKQQIEAEVCRDA